LIFILLFFYTIINAIQDGIDHHKGLKPLKDLWHITKQICRILLILIGCMIGKSQWSIELILILILYIIGMYYIWQHIYKHYGRTLALLDDQVKITTHIKWLDKFIGLDK